MERVKVMVGVFSLTRDRLMYTKTCFHSLRAKSGTPFIHCVVDNGSTDGTKQWLRSQYKPHVFLDLPQNVGISKGCNLALQAMRRFQDLDLIVKFDNDCFVQTDHVFARILKSVEVIRRFFPLFVLSPKVTGVVNQPKRLQTLRFGNVRVGRTSIVGGLFHCVPASLYTVYRYPETLPLASGQDDHFCACVNRTGGICGYLEDIEVEHVESTIGQALRYPRYFHRKHLEEV